MGYSVRLPWSVLNAARYGVPQDRRRLFLLGARKPLAPPLYPAPSTYPAEDPPEIGVAPGPSCLDALGDLPDAEDFDELRWSDEVETRNWETISAYAQEMRCLADNAWHYGIPRLWNPEVLTSSARTDHTPISRQRFAETSPGSVEPISRFFKLAATGISNTLRAGTDAARGAFTSPRPIHYRHARCVTVREMARLHGFPDWFRFHRTKWHGARQIGNAVPPPLARAVAGAIAAAMNLRRHRSRKTIPLGDRRLLSLEMSEAAAFWGIEAPIQRRDRKSGAKKALASGDRSRTPFQERAMKKKPLNRYPTKFPHLVCRSVSTQFMNDSRIAMFELRPDENGAVKLADERHYQLVPGDEISSADLSEYRYSRK